MSRVLIAAIAVLAAFPVLARAESEGERRDAALALIQFPWQQLQYEIVFLPPRQGFRAMTIPGKRRIEVYARPQDDIRLIAFDIAHELGHAIDLVHNTDETRRNWLRLRGLDPKTPWFGCNRCSDYKTGAGDFAETFALLLLGPEYFRGRIAPPPATADLPGLFSFFPKESVPPPALSVQQTN
jgi:hypothetical protein